MLWVNWDGGGNFTKLCGGEKKKKHQDERKKICREKMGQLHSFFSCLLCPSYHFSFSLVHLKKEQF